ncbi:MAG: hypothetical protein RL096_958, partial [Actinomycetota bacterium]
EGVEIRVVEEELGNDEVRAAINLGFEPVPIHLLAVLARDVAFGKASGADAEAAEFAQVADKLVGKLKAAGLQVFAANGGGVTIPSLGDETLAKPTVWVFGNEAWGFEPETLELVDREVAVPIYGAAESLNLATAASICLYASAFAQNQQ